MPLHFVTDSYFPIHNHINPLMISSDPYSYRRSISPLGTAADNLVLSPVLDFVVEDENGVEIEFVLPFNPIPINNLVSYENLNNDVDIQKEVTKYFYEKTMNIWMYSEFKKLLKYLVVKNGIITHVLNKNELENN